MEKGALKWIILKCLKKEREIAFAAKYLDSPTSKLEKDILKMRITNRLTQQEWPKSPKLQGENCEVLEN